MGYSPMQRAEAFIQAGELTDALEALNQQLTMMPSDDDARRLRAEILYRMPTKGDQRRALDDLSMLTHTRADDALLCSIIHERLDDIDNALDTIADAHNADPSHDRTTERYLYLLQKQGKFTQALDVLAPIIDSAEVNWRWLQWAGDLLIAQTNYADAIMPYTRALDALQGRYGTAPNTPAKMVEGDDTITQQAAMTVYGAMARLFVVRATCYEAVGNLEHARRDYHAAQALIPDDTLIRINRGILAAKMGDLQIARELCQSALDDASHDFRERYLKPALYEAKIGALTALIA